MAKNEQEIKKEIRVENKRTSENLNKVNVGFFNSYIDINLVKGYFFVVSFLYEDISLPKAY